MTLALFQEGQPPQAGPNVPVLGAGIAFRADPKGFLLDSIKKVHSLLLFIHLFIKIVIVNNLSLPPRLYYYYSFFSPRYCLFNYL